MWYFLVGAIQPNLPSIVSLLRESQHVLWTPQLTSRQSLYLKIPQEAPLHSPGLEVSLQCLSVHSQRKEVERVRNTEDCFGP